VVENRPWAGGSIVTRFRAKAARTVHRPECREHRSRVNPSSSKEGFRNYILTGFAPGSLLSGDAQRADGLPRCPQDSQTWWRAQGAAGGWFNFAMEPGSATSTHLGTVSFARPPGSIWWWFRYKSGGLANRQTCSLVSDDVVGGTSSASVLPRGRAACGYCGHRRETQSRVARYAYLCRLGNDGGGFPSYVVGAGRSGGAVPKDITISERRNSRVAAMPDVRRLLVELCYRYRRHHPYHYSALTSHRIFPNWITCSDTLYLRP